MEHVFKAWLIFLIASLALADEQSDPCPKLSSSSPCRCKTQYDSYGEGTEVQCSNINSKDTLYEELQKFRGYPIDNLKLNNLRVPFLPAGLSIGLSVKSLSIVNGFVGNLYSPKDATPSPLEGLEDSLREVHIINTMDVNKWLWPDVKKFKKLRKISVTNSPFDFVGHTFAEIGEGSLESISVRNSRVYRIHPQAFPELTNLFHADFEGNNLPYLVRTMFPNPAPKLEILNFRHNRLFTLNENMFENMPALKFLDFSRNDFKKFESVPFSPLWNQLEFLFLSENPFNCDCSLAPLKNRLTSNNLPKSNDFKSITCMNHGALRKTKLAELDTSSLQCY
nr:protein slit-like [Parasteatoda tepidariorum]